MRAAPLLSALATAVPRYRLDQRAVIARVRALFDGVNGLERLLGVFANSGISTRYSCLPLDWYDQPHGWRERNRVYIDNALELLATTTDRVLARARLAPTAIDAVVVVSTTGIATPSLDALLIERVGLRRDVRRLPVFGLGCAGGVIGLARAAEAAVANPGQNVLFLVVELCTLWFRRDGTKSNIVATALFGDGAAGALLSTDGAGPALVASGEYSWPGSRDIMGWDIAEDGLRAVFSRDIPQFVATELGLVVRAFLARHGLRLHDIDRFVCHPGGAKVVTALETAFELNPGALAGARQVLRDYGNMSAATVLFVLEQMLAAAPSWRRALLTGLGPGFSAGFVLLENR
jgi:alkylresorcinol/alkylpyrone synthase